MIYKAGAGNDEGKDLDQMLCTTWSALVGGLLKGLRVRGLIAPGFVVLQDLTCPLSLSLSFSIPLHLSLSKYSNIFGHYGHTYMEFEQAPSSCAGKRWKGRFNTSRSIYYDEILRLVSSL